MLAGPEKLSLTSAMLAGHSIVSVTHWAISRTGPKYHECAVEIGTVGSYELV